MHFALNLPRLLAYVGGSVGLGLVFYFGLSSALYYAKYVRDRARAAEWKCQPDRWLAPEMNRHAMRLGAANMAAGSVLSGAFAYFVFEHEKSTLYFDLRAHGLVFSAISITAVFLATDFCAYWAHRIYHTPRLFKLVHKWHHRYGAPTPFTVTAMHPVEFLTYQTIFLVPALCVPMYGPAYYALLIYVFYYNVCDHSGIHHKALAPWQPPSRFHDDHHRYFHCNFGQSSLLWDRLHGTMRRLGRRYGEDVYGGKGARVPAGAVAQADEFVRY